MGVHSIISIKNQENKYLQNYDERWKSYLFLNCKMPNGKDSNLVKEKVSEALKIDKENIEVTYVGEKTHTKFSQSDKIEKQYTHYFYNVYLKIKLPDNEFEVNNIKYKWFSYEDLVNDKRIMEVNSDIVQFIKEFGM